MQRLLERKPDSAAAIERAAGTGEPVMIFLGADADGGGRADGRRGGAGCSVGTGRRDRDAEFGAACATGTNRAGSAADSSGFA